MPLPEPELGLVISYSYLWRREYLAGRFEDLKDRPCVIVLAVGHSPKGKRVVVVPVTHAEPKDKSLAVELPQAVKRHLGLDAERSWVMLSESNRFIWPGYDLRLAAKAIDRYDYGYLPPRLFTDIVTRFEGAWERTNGHAVPRD